MCLRILTLVGLWLCLALLTSGTAAQETSFTPSGSFEPDSGDASQRSPDLSRVAQMIVERTNQFRENQGLEPVESNSQLKDAAEYFAQYMAEHSTYGHTADGRQPSERASMHGYEYCIVSENIAYRYSSAGFKARELARGFVRGWKNSPEHRENMVDSGVVHTGVAVARGEGNRYYAVQMFGRPKSMQIQFEISNESDSTFEYQIGDRTFPLPPRYTRTHTRCRPADSAIAWSGEGSDEPDRTLTPRDGGEYVVQRDSSGDLAIRRQ